MFYLLSDALVNDRTTIFAEAISFVLGGGDGSFREGDVMEHMTKLIRFGVPFNGPAGYEVGAWVNRLSPEEGLFQEVPADSYFAWTDPDYWDYDPHCVLYSKDEFIALFADCCRNYVMAHPERHKEFAQAMLVNGMSL